jgi:5-methylcytosine-specific restriction endonuclease McrA
LALGTRGQHSDTGHVTLRLAVLGLSAVGRLNGKVSVRLSLIINLESQFWNDRLRHHLKDDVRIGSASVAQQRFTDIHRRALWEAHRQRCLYCRKPLLFKELIIDHVIPETTAKDAERLADVRSTHALGVDFDILGDENLAPACHACNSDKLADLLSPERTALILTKIENRLPKFNRLKAKYQKQANDDDVGLGVSLALEKGLISPAQVGDILRRYEAGDPEVNLYQSLQFVGGVSVAALRRSEVDRLFDEPVALLNSQPACVDLEHADGRRREIRTTREYRDAIAQGFVPTCNAMVKLATVFDLPLAVFTAMERAQPARVSFIREPRTGIIDLKYMPVSMLPMGDISQEDDSCKTLEEVQRNGNLKVVSSTSHSLHIEYAHFERVIVEIMRADLDEDGIEDILVYWQDRSLQGTYGDGGTFVLTRGTADAQFERLLSWPEWKTPLQLWYSDIIGSPAPLSDIIVTPTSL